ncbi:hypothetical protein N7520_000251 [Penicillium odoratum]|uniref:uncharacterized protein n=1 Tax=Penicillium odoratum TaxID=1167516 RepID=UPI0025489BA4|nr:uncharacterized protein N7520_000251 [Penicillium odoratum]KAJ5777005.1 hypothetical protein N7520_000251 [Penicillium odoratum]
MFSKAANSTPAVPSRNALRVLRQLAFAGSVGTFCTVGAISYDVHRRIRVAEQIIENKRTIRTSAPNYDATASANRLALMMEAAEAGEFLGLDSLKHKSSRNQKRSALDVDHGALEQNIDDPLPTTLPSRNLRPTLAIRPTSLKNLAREYQDPANDHQNQIALAREREEDETRRAEGKPTLDESIQNMLVERRAVDAANLFLKVVPSNGDEAISWSRRALGYEIYSANCLQGNVFIARSMFHRLEKVSIIDTNLWATMIHMLAKAGHVESAAVIYEKYRFKYTIPVYLLEVTLRCLIESNRLSAAKWLFYSNIKHDENGGLCGAYLDGLWRKTHSVELVSKEFRKIVASLSELERNPTEKVFNALVKAYVDAGQYEDAEAIIHDMETKYGAKPGCRTLGLLLYGKALQCDWIGVLSGMREMHELGFTNQKQNFCQVFDRLWLEFWPSHSGSEIWSFLETCITEFNIKPDKVLHRHCIEGLVERCDPETLAEFSRMAEKHKWNTGIDHDATMRILEARRLAMQKSPVGFWKMLQSAKKQYGMVSMSRRIMGVGAEYYNIEKDKLTPIGDQAKRTEGQIVKTLSKSSVNLYVPITKRMEHYIHVGKFTEVQDLFQQGLDRGFSPKPLHIQLVIIATLLHKGMGGLSDAKHIIKKHWTEFTKRPSYRYTERTPRFVPIFFQQVMQLDRRLVSESTLIKLALFEFYEVCARTERFTVKHHCSAAVARRMIALHRPLVAVNLLTAVYMSKWRKNYGFDHVQLKMFIRAFTYVNNPRGVWWCMMTHLARAEPIHRDFLVEVERLTSVWESRFSPTTMETLRGLISVLKQKHDGSQYWMEINADPERKKQARAQLYKPPGKALELPISTTIEEAIVEFDEEMEFEYVIDRKQFTNRELDYWWSEGLVVQSNRRQPEHPQYPVQPHLNPHGKPDVKAKPVAVSL